MAAALDEARPSPVSTMTGIFTNAGPSGCDVRKPQPSMTGIIMSSKMRSTGRPARSTRRASSPLDAAIARYPLCSRIRHIASRMSASSSTTRIVGTASTSDPFPRPRVPARRRAAWTARRVTGAPDAESAGKRDMEGRAASRGRLAPDAAVHALDDAPHDVEAEPEPAVLARRDPALEPLED